MNARTHDAFAFASLLTVAVVMPPENMSVLTLFASIVGNIVGSLIPDMDQAGNRLWDLLPAGDFIGKIFRRVFYKHRTLTHSFLGLFLIYEALKYVLPYLLNPAYVDHHIVLGSVMVGYISHLIADSLTKEGLPLFFPIDINIGFPPFEFMRITTGKWVEKYIVFPLVGVYIILLILKYQHIFAQILRSVT